MRVGAQDTALGNREVDVLLTNTGRRCHMYGYPGLQRQDRGGRPLPTRTRRGGTYFTYVHPRLVVLEHGVTASFAVGWSDLGSHASACPGSYYLSVIPPGERQARRVRVSVDTCDGGVAVTAVSSGRCAGRPGHRDGARCRD